MTGQPACLARRNFDVDGKLRHRHAAIHFYLDLVVRDREVAADYRHDLLMQDAQEIGSSTGCPLMCEQNLEPIAGHLGGTASLYPAEHIHATLRPNTLAKRRFRSVGIVIGRFSPRSRRAAS